MKTLEEESAEREQHLSNLLPYVQLLNIIEELNSILFNCNSLCALLWTWNLEMNKNDEIMVDTLMNKKPEKNIKNILATECN